LPQSLVPLLLQCMKEHCVNVATAVAAAHASAVAARQRHQKAMESARGRVVLARADSDEPFLANIPADAQQSALQKLKALAEVRVRGECFAVFCCAVGDSTVYVSVLLPVHGGAVFSVRESLCGGGDASCALQNWAVPTFSWQCS
jgi:hypothetical protein